MSLYGAGNDPNQQYDASLKALQDSDQRTRDFINARRQRAVADEATVPDTSIPEIKQSEDATDLSAGPAPAAPAPQPDAPTLYRDKLVPPGDHAGEISEMSNRLSALRRAQTPATATADRPIQATPQGARTFMDLQTRRKIEAAIRNKTATPEQIAAYKQNYQGSASSGATPANSAQVAGMAAKLKSLQDQDALLQPDGFDNRFARQGAAAPGGADSFVNSIFQQESSGGAANTSKVNSQGVTGPMQMKQGTFDGAVRMGLVPGLTPQNANWQDPAQNTAVGKAYAAYLYKKYGGDTAKAAAAYFAGEPAVDSGKDISQLKDSTGTSVAQYVQQVTGRAGARAPQPQATAQAPAQPGQAPQPQQPSVGSISIGMGASAVAVPNPYTDQVLQAMKQQHAFGQNALRLAMMRYQANPSPETAQAYQTALTQQQQLQQGFYDAQAYQLTQAAQNGNGQAFKTLLNEASGKSGVQFQVAPSGDGSTFVLRTANGQVLGKGTPAELAGVLGYSINRTAQNQHLQIQQERAMSMAKNAHTIAVEQIKSSTELQKQLGINSSQELQKLIETNKLQLGRPDMMGRITVLNPATGKVVVIDPAKTDKVGNIMPQTTGIS